MPKLGIWALYIMSWILDEYLSEASVIILSAACIRRQKYGVWLSL